MKIAGSIIGIIGIALIWLYGSWQEAVAVFLVVFGHNLEKHGDG